MGLRCNGNQFASCGMYYAGATVVLSAYPPALQKNFSQTGRIRNITAGQGITSDYVGIPMGYVDKGWMMPQKAGMISSRAAVFGESGAATLYGGITTDGDADFSITTNTPAGELISTVQPGGAPASFGISTNTPALTASISGDGSTTFGISTNTPILGAEASLIGDAPFGMDGTLTAYAIGIMEGTTADTGVTVDNIVIALEAAVLPVNIVKVNDITVTGDGTLIDPWGP